MAKRYQMTWKPETCRWRKMHRGKWYSVSCKQLGVPETKEASWRAANAWWEQQQALADVPPRMTGWNVPPASATWCRTSPGLMKTAAAKRSKPCSAPVPTTA